MHDLTALVISLVGRKQGSSDMCTWLYWKLYCTSSEKVEEPTLTRTPTDKEVREGQKAKFDAAAKGTPKPAIKW